MSSSTAQHGYVTMGRRRFRLKLSCVCLARASPCVRVVSAASFRSRSSSSASLKYGNIGQFPSIGQDGSCGADMGEKEGEESGNKIMVVVDSSVEAKGALDWALSHAVQTQDTVLLLHVAKPSTQGAESPEKLNLKTYQLLLYTKNMCEKKRPGVQVKIVMVEGEEKGAAIVEVAKQQKVSLLVIGQRKRSIVWGMVRRWWGRRSTSCGIADYCIHNASCMTIAVRRKNKKLGGYLITTKRHKNFWLLA